MIRYAVDPKNRMMATMNKVVSNTLRGSSGVDLPRATNTSTTTRSTIEVQSTQLSTGGSDTYRSESFRFLRQRRKYSDSPLVGWSIQAGPIQHCQSESTNDKRWTHITETPNKQDVRANILVVLVQASLLLSVCLEAWDDHRSRLEFEESFVVSSIC